MPVHARTGTAQTPFPAVTARHAQRRSPVRRHAPSLNSLPPTARDTDPQPRPKTLKSMALGPGRTDLRLNAPVILQQFTNLSNALSAAIAKHSVVHRLALIRLILDTARLSL